MKKISTIRLIISGALVGLGSQYTISNFEGTGSLGIPTFSARSMLSTVVLFGTTMLTVTYQLHKWIPGTPRIIEIANESLPKNISSDTYMLVSLLVPFICFLIASKKSLKGMIDSLLHFAVGIILGCFFMLLGWSKI